MNILLPSQNKQLTDTEFQSACDLIDYYTQEGGEIRPYCEERGRDPDMYDRGNVWEGSFLDNLMRMILSKAYNNINRLRLIGWHFSAYRLFDLASVTEPPANEYMTNFYQNGIDEFPEDVDSVILDAIDPVARMQPIIPRLQQIAAATPEQYLIGQPGRFGEIAGDLGGKWVNGDSVRYWAAISAFHRSGVLEYLDRKIAERGFCRVMEIGPGYGGLAYHLKSIYGDKLQFICVDLVESLVFSSIYLTTLFDEQTLRYRDEEVISAAYKTIFVPSFRSPEFFAAINNVDLCINTVSMNEMDEQQVDYYAKNISDVLTDDGLFFEVNWKAIVAGPDRIDCKSYIALHFKQRATIENTEVSTDGNLDIWSNDISPSIIEAIGGAYPGQMSRFLADGS